MLDYNTYYSLSPIHWTRFTSVHWCRPSKVNYIMWKNTANTKPVLPSVLCVDCQLWLCCNVSAGWTADCLLHSLAVSLLSCTMQVTLSDKWQVRNDEWVNCEYWIVSNVSNVMYHVLGPWVLGLPRNQAAVLGSWGAGCVTWGRWGGGPGVSGRTSPREH